MTTKHTLGPWEARENRVLGPDGSSIADTWFHQVHVADETLANARLIAAAPDLLEALETMIRLRKERNPDGWKLAFETCEAAIAKAKGEDSP